ncbi:4-oxalocrotonate tautomerase [Methanocella sp. CWC-04]|uniref:4-oxalocrotonate tautomerase n=1 Tax=Methanooceanicella nereidis TaxID=2052831 RepID=A0AAP2RET0_9EURY|nr:4-oxalocrotonate tautomerase [Methanocella sp. CWC-04]
MDMPVIKIYMWEGRTKEAKKKIVSGITDVFVKEGVNPEAVTVIIEDVKKENWGCAGKLADE